ncbi:hypothetical protein ACFWMS_13995 [Peribacillus butanolivorans]|uniref:hypothetical protein n=1 Tax=Peribacillus butanolivorans TaxID=421767 RepID=UPI003653E610
MENVINHSLSKLLRRNQSIRGGSFIIGELLSLALDFLFVALLALQNNTKHTDKYIEMEYDWFTTLYYNPKYTRFFNHNKQIRSYLGHRFSIYRMIKKKKASETLIILLDKQAKKQNV